MPDRSPDRAGRTDALRMAFGGRVRAERQRLGWSLRELARRADCTPSNISRIEHAEHDCWLTVACRVSAALGVPLDKLTVPPDCPSCADYPLPGFTCNQCGRGGDADA